MAKKRTAIPTGVAEQVLFDADLSCCVCQARGNHIHHLDENPSNNESLNLVLLCFTHHDEMTAKGGLSRRLTPSLLARYRDHWHREVRSRREKSGSGSSVADMYYLAAFDAQSCVEVRKLRPRIVSGDWPDVEPLLWELSALLSSQAVHTRREAIECLDHVAISIRHKMPRRVAETIGNVTEECLELRRFPHDDVPDGVAPIEIEIFQYGLEVCGSLIHDGDKYLNDLLIVQRGCELLWKMMIHARHVKSEKLQEDAERCYKWHSRHRTKDAFRLMKLYRQHARAGGVTLPELPDELDFKLTRLAMKNEDRE